jgi:hypothetical protein
MEKDKGKHAACYFFNSGGRISVKAQAGNTPVDR